MSVFFLHRQQQRDIELASRLDFKAVLSPPDEVNHVLIRWGNTAGRDISALVLNRKVALETVACPEKTRTILRDHGFKCEFLPDESTGTGGIKVAKPGRWARIYRAYIFDLDLIMLYRKKGLRKKSIYVQVAKSLNKETQGVARTAIRAIYALGLDFGLVSLGIDIAGNIFITAINPAPILTPQMTALFSQAFKKRILVFWQVRQKPLFDGTNSDIVIGSDPEFMLRDRSSGRMIPASMFFPMKGVVGCDQRLIRITPKGRYRPLAELRPLPSRTPEKLVKNIRSALIHAVKLARYRHIEWVAGSEPFKGFPIGGHIHFSNIKLNSHLLRALDNYLAIPLILLENSKTAVKRRSKYGYLGEFRVKEHGGFEYRTLSSWLVSHRITTAVLCLSFLIVNNYSVLKKDFFLGRAELHKAFYDCEKEPLYEVFNQVWSEIERLPGFNFYHEQLSPLHEMIMGRKRWKEDVDLRRNWGLLKPKKART